jgi:cytochrome c2
MTVDGRGARYSHWAVLGALIGALGLVGCQSAPTSEPAAKPAELSGAAAEGKEVFLAKGCVACHRAPNVPEAQGTMGPNLARIGNPTVHPKIAAVVDNTPENMKRWLQEPQKVKPGSAMPSLGLTDAEAVSLTAFLETLK